MHEIKHLAEGIREELDDAEKYAREAVKHAGEDPEDASTYADLSRQELGHANRSTKWPFAISKRRRTPVSIPRSHAAVWDWEHERMLDRTAHVKTLLSMM